MHVPALRRIFPAHEDPALCQLQETAPAAQTGPLAGLLRLALSLGGLGPGQPPDQGPEGILSARGGIVNYSVEHEDAAGDIRNCLLMLGAMRRGSGDPQLLESVSRRLWAALLKLEPRRRQLWERTK